MPGGCRVAIVLLVLAVAGIRTPAAAAPPDDRLIVPGDRIGHLRLAGTLAEIEALHGAGVAEGKPESFQTKTYAWAPLGLRVGVDEVSRNVLWIVVSGENTDAWRGFATAEDIGLGTPGERLIVRMPWIDRILSDGRGKRFFNFDDLGIRFVVAGRGARAGGIAEIRIAWAPRQVGDLLIVPGERISAVRVGATLAEARAVLGGGFQQWRPWLRRPERTLYGWWHLGLSLLEEGGRVVEVRASRVSAEMKTPPRYTTLSGLGPGSTLEDVRRGFGAPPKVDGRAVDLWTDPWAGIAFSFSFEGKRVGDVRVFARRGPLGLSPPIAGALATALAVVFVFALYVILPRRRRWSPRPVR